MTKITYQVIHEFQEQEKKKRQRIFHQRLVELLLAREREK